MAQANFFDKQSKSSFFDQKSKFFAQNSIFSDYKRNIRYKAHILAGKTEIYKKSESTEGVQSKPSKNYQW